MKIRTKKKSYEEVMSLTPQKHQKPRKQLFLLRVLLRLLSIPELLITGFRVKKIGMEKLGKKEPCLVLMNHSCFLDLEIASTLLFPRRFSIVCTSDGFVGKNLLMRLLGCIPTKKFVFDLTLIRDIKHAVTKLNSSVLLYPEASYSFDGTATPLPETVGQLIKMLGIPVVIIETRGAFARQPLYNNLKKRKVKVTAEMIYLLSPADTKEKSAEEINALVGKHFAFDHFRHQQENRIAIKEKYRADFLHRVLYKCPNCLAEGMTEGKGTDLVCHSCQKTYHLDEYGFLKATEGETEFDHIPDWYAWQRNCVRQELLDGTYLLDCDVDICMQVDTKCIYRVGEGHLLHTTEGFRLTGCDGKLDYSQKPVATYSLYSDYYWYELGDMICIGNQNALYYCFPKSRDIPVAKARLAAEELYKLVKREKITR